MPVVNGVTQRVLNDTFYSFTCLGELTTEFFSYKKGFSWSWGSITCGYTLSSMESQTLNCSMHITLPRENLYVTYMRVYRTEQAINGQRA